jgi:hypothetical protein
VSTPGRGRARRVRLLTGGLIGGALVLADQARRRRGPVVGGLRAFEDAPCYREEHPREAPPEERASTPSA